MDAFVYLNGQILPQKEAKISLFDLGIMRGYGVFDFFRSYNRCPFHLWDHLKRFVASACAVDIPLPYTLEEMAQIVQQLVETAPFSDANIKVFLTGGISADQYMPEDKPTFFALIYPMVPLSKASLEKGFALMTEMYERPYSQAKTIHYLPAIVALRRAQKQGFHEVLFIDKEENILEGGTTNFFGIKEGKVVTTNKNIIFGITRKVVLDLLKKRNIPCELRPISLDEIHSFEGAFITSSSKEISAVSKINDVSFMPHPLADLLRQDYRDYAHSLPSPFEKIIA